MSAESLVQRYFHPHVGKLVVIFFKERGDSAEGGHIFVGNLVSVEQSTVKLSSWVRIERRNLKAVDLLSAVPSTSEHELEVAGDFDISAYLLGDTLNLNGFF